MYIEERLCKACREMMAVFNPRTEAQDRFLFVAFKKNPVCKHLDFGLLTIDL